MNKLKTLLGKIDDDIAVAAMNAAADLATRTITALGARETHPGEVAIHHGEVKGFTFENLSTSSAPEVAALLQALTLQMSGMDQIQATVAGFGEFAEVYSDIEEVSAHYGDNYEVLVATVFAQDGPGGSVRSDRSAGADGDQRSRVILRGRLGSACRVVRGGAGDFSSEVFSFVKVLTRLLRHGRGYGSSHWQEPRIAAMNVPDRGPGPRQRTVSGFVLGVDDGLVRMVVVIGRVAAAVGKGLFAGMVGTAAMTASSTLEAKLRDRKPSTAPLDAAAKVLGFEAVGEREKARLSTLAHWAYGTLWGAPRGVLAVVGVPAPGATLVHLGAVWGGEVVMLPKLGVAPPIKEWGATRSRSSWGTTSSMSSRQRWPWHTSTARPPENPLPSCFADHPDRGSARRAQPFAPRHLPPRHLHHSRLKECIVDDQTRRVGRRVVGLRLVRGDCLPGRWIGCVASFGQPAGAECLVVLGGGG